MANSPRGLLKSGARRYEVSRADDPPALEGGVGSVAAPQYVLRIRDLSPGLSICETGPISGLSPKMFLDSAARFRLEWVHRIEAIPAQTMIGESR